ncbi:MAG: HAD hydrolase family protein [Phycisphaerales bacterium]|nr:MAG: HAD hydrolase family protein [Phycisphaerales bacterium]
MNFASIDVLILDVDGVLTDGTIVTTADGDGARRFNVQDGCALKLWQRCGGKVAIISGRGGEAVTRRADELGIDWVHTGISEKLPVYEAILAEAGCTDEAVAYLGDDLPDLPPLARAGFPVAVADAVPVVKRASSYVTRRRGGCGAVAEVIELLLRKKKRWSRALLSQV